MSRLGRLAGEIALITAVASCALAGGCSRPRASLELISYKNPSSPEPYTVRLTQCAYRRDAQGDYQIVGRATRGAEAEGGKPITQLLCIHVFWKPQPGRTFANDTTDNATIKFAITTSDGTVTYAGTGFVYPKQKRFSNRLRVRIERAELRVETQTGEAPELLGDTRLTGEFTANEDSHLTVDVAREIELRAAGATVEPPNSASGDERTPGS